MLRSDKIKEGRYFQGGKIHATEDAINWIDMKTFPRADTDIYITLPAKYHHKPWLLAYDAYGKQWLGWFILQYNNIINELDGFVTDTVIALPTKSRLFNELLTTTVASKL